MTEQLIFDLPTRTATGRDAFFVSPANQAALDAVDGWRDWPGRMLLLCGPGQSGKSHLATIWTDQTGATPFDINGGGALPQGSVLVDGLDQVAGDATAEEALFHLYNHMHTSTGFLLITSPAPPARLGIGLPDLASRLATIPVATLLDPDDLLLGAVLGKHFSDRQLTPNPVVTAHLLRHMERSFESAARVVAALDQMSLRTKKPITRAMAAQVLQS